MAALPLVILLASCAGRTGSRDDAGNPDGGNPDGGDAGGSGLVCPENQLSALLPVCAGGAIGEAPCDPTQSGDCGAVAMVCHHDGGCTDAAGDSCTGIPTPDAGFTACCLNGELAACFQYRPHHDPARPGSSCNYCGGVLDCGNGTCVEGGGFCGPRGCPAGSVTDAGTWLECCEFNRVSSCLCDGGASCGFGFTRCGDAGACADPGQSCP